ncbi:retrovirus-related pol polyprotein from transposon TNT 1-94 [Tanacetum coccineum]
MKITILKTNTPYPSRKIQRIRACTHQRPQRNKDQYAVSRENQYAVFKIWNQYNILEDIKSGHCSNKSPIRRVTPTTSFSRPQLKRNQLEDRVMLNNSQGKKTKQPNGVPISSREPKRTMNQSVLTSHKKIVAIKSTIKKPRSIIRKLYEQVSKTCSWWYPKFTPSGYKWKLKSPIGRVNTNVSMPLGNASRTANILEPMTPRCSKHMTGNLKLITNFVEKFLGTMKFGNDQIAPILVAFRKSTCYIRDLKGNDLLTGSHGTDLYTWTHFLRSKDETPEVLIDFLKLVQRGLHAQVRTVRTDKGTKFLNKTLHAYFAQEGIEHQTSVARTPKQNSVVERRNHTLVEAARTMLSAAKVPLYFWAEAITTTFFTQNRSLVIP